MRLPQAAESPALILWRTYVKEGFSVMNPGMVWMELYWAVAFSPRDYDCVTSCDRYCLLNLSVLAPNVPDMK